MKLAPTHKTALAISAIKTDLFEVGMDLPQFLIDQLTSNPPAEKMILAVTSKIVSVAENRLIAQKGVDKRQLVERESDVYFGEIGYGCHLTIKHGLLIPSAGIDESNSAQGDYILYPVDPWKSARDLWQKLSKYYGLQHFGVILTDSHTTPLRRGVTGVALSYWGFQGVQNFVGRPDLFGRTMRMTQVNVADALATAAVLQMGETNESCPLALIEGACVDFREMVDPSEIQIPLEEDLYGPILKPLVSQR